MMIQNSGLKLERVAEKMGMSRQTLWAKVNGKREFTKAELYMLFDILQAADPDSALPLFIRDDEEIPVKDSIIRMIERPQVVDPKGELIRSLDGALREHGFKVVPIDLHLEGTEKCKNKK
jgi:transcriptional regulator with XRE-family HTH domain